jgi:hypothetical protein
VAQAFLDDLQVSTTGETGRERCSNHAECLLVLSGSEEAFVGAGDRLGPGCREAGRSSADAVVGSDPTGSRGWWPIATSWFLIGAPFIRYSSSSWARAPSRTRPQFQLHQMHRGGIECNRTRCIIDAAGATPGPEPLHPGMQRRSGRRCRPDRETQSVTAQRSQNLPNDAPNATSLICIAVAAVCLSR